MQLTLRDAIIDKVYLSFPAAYPGVPLVVDGAPFDWNSPPPQFVRFEVRFNAGRQVGMSASPVTRIFGTVYVTAYNREGEGARGLLEMLDWFGDTLAYKTLPGGSLLARAPDGNGSPKGWYTEKLKIPFQATGT